MKPKSHISAFFLALLGGGFGVHKFWLKQVGWGIAYLLFCWTLIPFIASTVEGIWILNHEDQFNEDNNSQYSVDELGEEKDNAINYWFLFIITLFASSFFARGNLALFGVLFLCSVLLPHALSTYFASLIDALNGIPQRVVVALSVILVILWAILFIIGFIQSFTKSFTASFKAAYEAGYKKARLYGNIEGVIDQEK